jgi:hypothetical protein
MNLELPVSNGLGEVMFGNVHETSSRPMSTIELEDDESVGREWIIIHNERCRVAIYGMESYLVAYYGFVDSRMKLVGPLPFLAII